MTLRFRQAIRAHDRALSAARSREARRPTGELGAWSWLLAMASIGALVAMLVGVVVVRFGDAISAALRIA